MVACVCSVDTKWVWSYLMCSASAEWVWSHVCVVQVLSGCGHMCV